MRVYIQFSLIYTRATDLEGVIVQDANRDFKGENMSSEREPLILIVEDDERNVRLLKAMLMPENYRVIAALNGEEALREMDRVKPDLILLDVMMPGMDGFEVCRRIKEDEKNKGLPILMVTALTAKEDRIKALDAGADDFLSKPIDKTELLVRVKSMLRMKSYYDQLGIQLHEIEEKNEKLLQLEAMRDELTHMVVHDLNIPLSGIIGCLEMVLSEDANLNEEHREWLTDSIDQSFYLAGMIRNILDINKTEQGKLELAPVKSTLARITEGAIDLLKGKVKGKNISISILMPEDIPSVFLDPDLIKRVIANLLDNAIRHTPAGGEIEISMDYDPGEDVFYFRIRDAGKGLKPEYHELIFDKYRQIQNRKEGVTSGRSGLGLVFCKMAIEAHHGKIWVENNETEKGTTFGFLLPANHLIDEEQGAYEKEYSDNRRQ